MKLKFINCLLAVAIVGGSAQILTSCKDNTEDMRAQLEAVDESISNRVNDNLTTIRDLQDDVKDLQDSIKAHRNDFVTMKEFQDSIAALNARIGDAGVSTDEVNNLISDALKDLTETGAVANALNDINAAMDALEKLGYDNMGDYFNYLELTLTSLQNQINNLDIPAGCDLTALNNFMNTWQSKLPTIEKNAQDALDQATKNKNDIATLNEMIAPLTGLPNEFQNLKTEVTTAIEALKTDVAAAQTKADEAYDLAVSNLEAAKAYTDACITNLRGGYEGTLADLNQAIIDGDKAAQDAIAKNTEAIKNLNTEVNNLKEKMEVFDTRITNLENRITSIVLQGTDNPVFGYLSTPLGVQSNILMAYSGSSSNSIKMPNFDPTYEYNGKEVLTEADYNILHAPMVNIPAGEYTRDCDGNLGIVYLTVNPANIDLEGKTFEVVNSQGKVFPVELRNLRPSNTELTFGYSRTETSTTGFYEADATVPVNAADLKQLRIDIEPGLKDAAKKVIEEKSKSSLASLAKALYNQVDGFIPALGVRGAWLEGTNAYNVTSNYGMSATVFQPLSFKFLVDKANPDRHLPEIDLGSLRDKFDLNFTIDHITLPGLDLDIKVQPIEIKIDNSDMDFNFDFDLNFDDIDLSLGDIDTNITIDGLDNVEMTITIPDFPTDATATGTITKGGAGEEDKVDITVTLVREDVKFENVTASLSQVGNKIAEPIANKLEQVVDKINESLNDNFKTQLSESINSQLSDKINEQINQQLKDNLDKIFNKVSNQINEQIQSMIDDVIDQIQNKFNKYISDMETQINDQLDKLVGQINNTLSDKVNGLIDRVESSRYYDAFQNLINRVNSIIQDPNHYLQATMLYKAGGTYGKMSTSKAMPSMMKLAGGNSLMLIPTTFTAETVTPAYKKFVAVTNVYKTGDYSVNAQAGNAACKNILSRINSTSGSRMNQVIDGNVRTIALNLEGTAGYTIEIVYQALDYHGYTSTQKYYVQVR